MEWHRKGCAKVLLVGALCTCICSIAFPERYEPPNVGRSLNVPYFSPELHYAINGDVRRGFGVFDVDHGGHGSSGATGPAFSFRTT